MPLLASLVLGVGTPVGAATPTPTPTTPDGDLAVTDDGPRAGVTAAAVDGTHTISTVAGLHPIQPLAVDSRLPDTSAVAVTTAGDVFIALQGSRTVHRVDNGTGIMTLVAGDGTYGPLTAGPATATGIGLVTGMTVDGSGDLYLSLSTAVVKVDGLGDLSVVAGTSTAGYSGDGGSATAAQLDSPRGLAVDGAGNLYIADTGNDVIRRVDAGTGDITTVAGNGSYGTYAGDGIAALSSPLLHPDGVAVTPTALLIQDESYLFSVDLVTGLITRVAGQATDGFAGDGGPATGASLAGPAGIVVDSSDNIYLADRYNGRVRRIDASTGTITTVAGTGDEGYSADGTAAAAADLRLPHHLGIDGADNVYLVDGVHVRRFGGSNELTTVAGTFAYGGDGGPATAAHFARSNDVAVGPDKAIYIADEDNDRIRRIDPVTGVVTTVAGSGARGFAGDGGPATAASFTIPTAVVVGSEGDLFVADAGNHRVRKVDHATGVISTIAGTGTGAFSGDGGPATAAELALPKALALHDGVLYVVDGDNHRIRSVDLSSGVIETVAGNGNSSFGGDGGPASGAGMSPSDVAVDSDGNLYFTDHQAARLRRVDAETGTITTVAGDGGTDPSGDGGPATAASVETDGLAFDPDGNLYVSGSSAGHVRRIDKVSGVITTVAGGSAAGHAGDGGPAAASTLTSPKGMAYDPGGLLIADRGTSLIRYVSNPDTVDPTVTVTFSPASVDQVDNGAEVTVTYTCADTGGSGLTSCTGHDGTTPIASGSHIDTTVAGTRTLTFTAADWAGNTTTETRTIVVDARHTRPADDQITRLYQAALGRTPDDEGLAHWSGLYRGGTALRDLAIEMMGSDEFVAVYGAAPSDDDFVDALYQNVLGRAGDPDGRAYWLDQLDGGATRVDVLLAFTDSAENVARTGTSSPLSAARARVLRMYGAALGRLPDDAGLAYWTDAHEQGMTLRAMAAQFRTSDEYQALYGAADDEAFVDALYQNILGRAGDPEGREYWLGQLGSVSRDEILVSFSESHENRDRTNTAP